MRLISFTVIGAGLEANPEEARAKRIRPESNERIAFHEQKVRQREPISGSKKREVLLGKLIYILENCRQMNDGVAITCPIHR
jgi:hypothetical protein